MGPRFSRIAKAIRQWGDVGRTIRSRLHVDVSVSAIFDQVSGNRIRRPAFQPLSEDASFVLSSDVNLWFEVSVTVTRMGPTLNMSTSLGAYTLADRGTWISFPNRGDLTILVEGDKALFNQYGVMLVNPTRHPTVQVNLGRQFIDWLTSAEDQRTIAGYKIDGEQLFFPDAPAPS